MSRSFMADALGKSDAANKSVPWKNWTRDCHRPFGRIWYNVGRIIKNDLKSCKLVRKLIMWLNLALLEELVVHHYRRGQFHQ